jgi:MSHA biogenesis protein MshN
MSLINDMLQDLEKRSASERSAVPRHVRVLPPVRRRRAQHYALSGAIGAAAIAAVALYLYQPGFAIPEQQPLIVTQAAAAPHIAIREEAPASPPPAQTRPPVSAAAVLAADTASTESVVQPAAEPAAPTSAPPSAAKGAGARAELPTIDATSAIFSLRMDALPAERAVTRAGTPNDTGQPVIERKVRELTVYQIAENEYRAGANLLNHGRLAEAQERFTAALRHAPNHVGARQALLGLLVQANRVAEAEHILHEGLKVDLAQPGFAMALARLQIDRGDSAAAVETLQRSLASAAASPDYLAFLAALLQGQGRHVQAAELYHSALALAPRSGVWLMGLGISLQALNRNAEAQEAFRRAKASDTLNGELQAFVDHRLRQLQ